MVRLERGGEQTDMTYAIQYCFHQLNGHLCLLDQIILGIFNFDPSGVLTSGASRFQTMNIVRLADRGDLGDRTDTRLFGGIKVESRGVNVVTGLHCGFYVCGHSCFPRLQE